MSNSKYSTMPKTWWVVVISLLSFCCTVPYSDAYSQMHFQSSQRHKEVFNPIEYFLVILVDARHLDYTDNRSLLKTIAKHPSDGSKNGDVGHAWIYLQGVVDEQPVYLEGGHSGECGVVQPKYFDGVMNHIDYGVADPDHLPCIESHDELNPIKYLWETLHDGFFQWGSGGHCPTYAAKIDLTPEQFMRICAFVESYPYSDYALIGNQCSSFAMQVAALAGVDLDCETTISIQPGVYIGGKWLHFWNDPSYAELTISSPDILERSLIQAVAEGKAKCALKWYQKTHPVSLKMRMLKIGQVISRLPERYGRYWRIN
jgi:hypothetical protein